MNIRTITPKFGENYDVGYIGFTMTAGNAITRGIAYFERWEDLSDIQVAHVFVVTGENELVEAHIEHGVQRDCIGKYFDDPNVLVFFRKPVSWQKSLGEMIAYAAESKIGCPYATGLIAADLMADTLFGHWLNKVFRQWPRRCFCWLFDQPNRYICSELAAYALASQLDYRNLGCLRFPLDTIDPQELFEDTELFEPWANESGHGPQLNSIDDAR